MKKFKLQDLQVESFVTTLNEQQVEKIRGGFSGVTEKENPKTTEETVSTCTTGNCPAIYS